MVDSVKINNLTTKDLETNFELDVSDNSIPICYISKISYPTFDANTTLTYLDNIKYIDDFKNSGIKILLTQKNLIKNISLNPEICFVFTPNPSKSFTEISNYAFDNNLYETISNSVDKSIYIDESSYVSDKVNIGKNVKVGKNCVINENTIIEDNVSIGDNCIIGSEGLNIFRGENNNNLFNKSIGGVLIEKGVRVDNFVNISKGTGGRVTKIGSNTMIGCFVSIGHDANISSNSIIVDGTKLSGHVFIGENVYLGINTTVLQNIEIEKNSKTGIGTVVTRNIKENSFVIGNPGRNIS